MCDPEVVAARVSAPIPRPRWGVLYAIVFLALTALPLADMLAPDGARPVLDGALAAAALVAIALWIRGNRAALDQQGWCECAAATITVRVIPSRRPRDRRAMVAPGHDGRRGRRGELGTRELVPRDQR